MGSPQFRVSAPERQHVRNRQDSRAHQHTPPHYTSSHTTTPRRHASTHKRTPPHTSAHQHAPAHTDIRMDFLLQNLKNRAWMWAPRSPVHPLSFGSSGPKKTIAEQLRAFPTQVRKLHASSQVRPRHPTQPERQHTKSADTHQHRAAHTSTPQLSTHYHPIPMAYQHTPAHPNAQAHQRRDIAGFTFASGPPKTLFRICGHFLLGHAHTSLA